MGRAPAASEALESRMGVLWPSCRPATPCWWGCSSKEDVLCSEDGRCHLWKYFCLEPADTLAPPAPLSCFCLVIPLIPPRRASPVWLSAPSAPSESEEGPPFLALEQDRLLSVCLVSKRPFRLRGACAWLTETLGGKRDELGLSSSPLSFRDSCLLFAHSALDSSPHPDRIGWN